LSSSKYLRTNLSGPPRAYLKKGRTTFSPLSHGLQKVNRPFLSSTSPCSVQGIVGLKFVLRRRPLFSLSIACFRKGLAFPLSGTLFCIYTLIFRPGFLVVGLPTSDKPVFDGLLDAQCDRRHCPFRPKLQPHSVSLPLLSVVLVLH